MSISDQSNQITGNLTNPLVRTATVRAHFDGISDMTLWRWINYRDFPKPKRICGRNYWNPKDIEQWQQDNAS